MQRKFNDCIWIKNQHIWRNEIFPNVLSEFGLHSALGTSALDFIQLQFSVNQTVFPELAFSQRLYYMFFLNFICNYSLSLFCIWSLYELQMKYTCIPAKKAEWKFWKKYVWLTENWNWIKSEVLMPSIIHVWIPNLDKTLKNVSFLQICWFFIHIQSFFNLTCNPKFSCNRLRWSPLFNIHECIE